MMKSLPRDLENFFHASINGFELLIGENRKRNKAFIAKVFYCLLQERGFSKKEIEHLRSFKQLADLITIPEFHDAKSLIGVQKYLRQCQHLPQAVNYRYLLEYLFFLLCRHGEIAANLQDIRTELHIWELAHEFKLSEQGLMADYIHWLEANSFSRRSILDSLSELRKFCSWLESSGLTFERASNDRLRVYLTKRALKHKTSSKQRILSNIRPFLSFYKEALNPTFCLPSMTIQVQRNRTPYNQLSSEHIQTLMKAIAHENHQHEAALMLCLLIGYGVPLKCLPVLRRENDLLKYTYRCQSRTGEQVVHIPVIQGTVLENLILGYRREISLPYLFQSRTSKKKRKPIGVGYCQAVIQEYISGILGFEVTAMQAYRDCLRDRARNKRLTQFIDDTALYPFRVGTKLYYWLAGEM